MYLLFSNFYEHLLLIIMEYKVSYNNTLWAELCDGGIKQGHIIMAHKIGNWLRLKVCL